jgi:hypothetical protein
VIGGGGAGRGGAENLSIEKGNLLFANEDVIKVYWGRGNLE